MVDNLYFSGIDCQIDVPRELNDQYASSAWTCMIQLIPDICVGKAKN